MNSQHADVTQETTRIAIARIQLNLAIKKSGDLIKALPVEV